MRESLDLRGMTARLVVCSHGLVASTYAQGEHNVLSPSHLQAPLLFRRLGPHLTHVLSAGAGALLVYVVSRAHLATIGAGGLVRLSDVADGAPVDWAEAGGDGAALNVANEAATMTLSMNCSSLT